MAVKDRNRVLVLGGAGFIGSNIAETFVKAGYKVTVIDGILGRTGASRRNLDRISRDINFISSPIQNVKGLGKIITESDLIIDSMAWAFHRLALADPQYDLKLNAESHLHLIRHLEKNNKVIYIGSSGQYGNPHCHKIVEETDMVPEDIQGIHKLAAESYYRVYARLKGFQVLSLRFPNCFGEHQQVKGEDIGLIGLFIRDLIQNKNTTVYGKTRRRFLVYVKDLAEVVLQLSQKNWRGFEALNLGGHSVLVEDLVKTLISLLGEGAYTVKTLPYELKVIDVGLSKFNDAKIHKWLGKIPRTNLPKALKATIDYFKERLQ